MRNLVRHSEAVHVQWLSIKLLIGNIHMDRTLLDLVVGHGWSSKAKMDIVHEFIPHIAQEGNQQILSKPILQHINSTNVIYEAY